MSNPYVLMWSSLPRLGNASGILVATRKIMQKDVPKRLVEVFYSFMLCMGRLR